MTATGTDIATPAQPAPRPGAPEPAAPGVYRDRDGDVWVRAEHGWLLCLQNGVAVDTTTVWQWVDGHVRDYAPFALLLPS